MHHFFLRIALILGLLPALFAEATRAAAAADTTTNSRAPAATAPTPGATIIVLDASGSMRERLKGETKMDIARRAIRELVASLPDGAQLGLVVYSHRRATACDDIELVIKPGQLDRAAFVAAVDAIKPNGRTPLSASVQFAAEALDYTKQTANVILLSDGLETCNQDPCATAAKLEAQGRNFTVHAVAFDLSAREAKSIECLATATGGRFLQANDAASLKDALVFAVAETVAAAAPTPPPPEQLTAATLEVPPTVAAGAVFSVAWTGPDNSGDYITIVPQGAPDHLYENYSYTRQGSPLPLTALIEAGEAEVRYVTGRSHTVLARASIKVGAVEVTLSAADTVTAGAPLTITWTGPKNTGDFLTIVPQGTPDAGFAQYADASVGSPVDVAGPMEAGAAEIRYVSGQGRKVLARRPVTVVAAEVTLTAADEALAGSEAEVTWTGPNNAGDFVTIVPQGARDDAYAGYMNTSAGSPVRVVVPIDPGAAEIRYLSGSGRKVLARRPLTVVAAEVALTASETAVAGAEVEITWTGPNNAGDFITIVPQGARDDAYAGYKNTTAGSPLRVVTPIDPIACEIRYVSGPGRKVLARRPLALTAPQITLQAPARATVGSTIEIVWTGPDNPGDYLTVVPKSAADGSSLRYAYTRSGSPAKVGVPPAPGPCEVRYMSGQGNKVLARVDLVLAAP